MENHSVLFTLQQESIIRSITPSLRLEKVALIELTIALEEMLSKKHQQETHSLSTNLDGKACLLMSVQTKKSSIL